MKGNVNGGWFFEDNDKGVDDEKPFLHAKVWDVINEKGMTIH